MTYMPGETISTRGRPAEILLVEDNYGDVLLTQDAFSAARLPNTIRVASDGEQAIEMLHKTGPYSNMATPDLILLDLNLPKKDGKEVLAEIKRDEKLMHIPVLVLTSSGAQRDVIASYRLHANGYIIKPESLEQFSDVVASIEHFWFNNVVVPDRPYSPS